MRASDAQLAEGLDLIDLGAAVFDRDSRLTYCNPAFRALRGYPEDVCRRGATISDLLRYNAERGDFGPGDPEAQVAERLAEIGAAADRAVEHRMADGQILAICYRRTGSGGLFVTYEDRTAQRRAEEALAKSEERYALAARVTSDFIYDWDVAGDRLHVSDVFKGGLQFDADAEGPQGWLQRIHPDDRETYVNALRAHFRGEGDRMDVEFRAQLQPGVYAWIHDSGAGVRDETGRVVRMVGAMRDISEIKAAQAERDRIEERLMSSLATISDGILLVDPENRVQLWNDRYQEIFSDACGGKDVSAVIAKDRPFFDMIRDGYNMGMFKPHPGGVDAWVAARRKAWEKPRTSWELELGDGKWILLNERAMPDGGRVSVYTDITGLKRREAEAEAARRQFEDAIESISTGFAMFDAEDRLLVWNSRFRDYFAAMSDVFVPGATFDEMITASIDRGLFPAAKENRDAFRERLLATRARGDGKVRENLLSSGLWLQISDHRTRDGGLVSIYTDVTELKIREAELEAAVQEFNAVLDNIDYGIVFMGPDLRARIVNRAFGHLWNIPQEFIDSGPQMRELIEFNRDTGLYDVAPEDWDAWLDDRVAQIEAGAVPPQEIRRTDGRTIIYQCVVLPDGGRMLTYFDVTELKRREEELSRQSAILEATLENMGQGITMVDRDLRTVAYNRKFFELMEFPEETFGKGFSMEDAFRYNAGRGEYGPGDVEQQVAERMELARKFLPHRFERTRPDGTVLEIVGNPVEGGGLVSTYTDITERKKAAEEIAQREAKLEATLAELNAVLDTIDYGVILLDSDLRARIVNRVMIRLWNFPDGFIESRPTFRDMVELNRKSGVYVVGPEGWDAWVRAREDRVRAGAFGPVEMARADGVILRHQCVALPDGGRMLTYFDITEMKAREAEISRARDAAEAALSDLRKAQERLIQAEKMASLGQLTAGIAHEIKNPLNFVNNFARLSDEMVGELAEVLEGPIAALDEEARDDAEELLETVRGNLAKIAEHGKRADSIVKNMLLHSREGPSERQQVALNGIAAEALNLAYHGARAENPQFNIRMTTDFAEDIGEVECFPQDLMRVCLNLVTNGMYAAHKRRAAEGDGFEPEIAVSTRKENGAAVIEVRDNGVGIPAEAREKIFLPFFTTKPAGEGTGLGLSLSYDIVVKQHGGDLTVESEPMNFTAFRVTLPLGASTPQTGDD